MGGSVAVAIRKRNGEIICRDRWTNSTPFYFKSLRMREGDEAFVQEYLDLAKDKKDAPHVPLAPLGYGLVVIDYVTNHMLSMQGYSSYDQFTELDAFGPIRDTDEKASFQEQ